MKFKTTAPQDEEDIDEIEEILPFAENKDIPPPRIRERHFNHAEFGDALIEEYNIITLKDKIYIYEDGYYQPDERIIENKMIELYPEIKMNQRREVLSYIKIKTHRIPETIETEPYIINLKNTRLDIKTGKMLNFSPEAMDFTRIPVEYNPSAYNADLDKMLNRVFCGDREVIDLFGEMVGYCLMKHLKYEKGFLFSGSGSNGKSTILELIKSFLGPRNFSSFELDKITKQFSTAGLEHKLANIGDDINSRALSDTGTLKKLFSGQSLEVEKKGIDAYTLRSYATHIYSCNEIPRSYDKTDGFYRRWVMIPFNARFTKDDPDFDPLISEKIVTANALSYLLNVALKGAQRLIKRGRFTEPNAVIQALEEYKRENSLVLSWISDTDNNEDYLTSKPQKELFSEFSDWCRVSNIKEIPDQRRFIREIRDHYHFSSKQKRVSGDFEKRVYYFSKT